MATLFDEADNQRNGWILHGKYPSSTSISTRRGYCISRIELVLIVLKAAGSMGLEFQMGYNFYD